MKGASLHYAPPSPTVLTPTNGIVDMLLRELGTLSPRVRRGPVWTTDAPYRETPEQLRFWADHGVLAVEMQSASLFAFAHARGAQVAMVALVSNSVDEATGHFDTGGNRFRVDVLTAVAPGRASFHHARAWPARYPRRPGQAQLTSMVER